MDPLRCGMSCEELAAFEAKLAPKLLDMETMGCSRARFVARDLLSLRHYKAHALGATPLGDTGSVVLVDCESQTSFNKLRYDVGVHGDLYESRVALFNDAYELSGWFLSSISPFNFNDEEAVPWMNVAVEHMKANPMTPLPSRRGPPSGKAATSHAPKQSVSKPKPKPYVPPHNRGGKCFSFALIQQLWWCGRGW
ncbi:hypothetical protein CYMTET_39724 [Cymbomonas tetramitiformis]|uniref:Uncharacterized protein n=1 Tax=Cymbomonas tetramitiformis TaxID=36881 RepID=A0AAE0F3P0_9CHLO|nr:hypothetical protein CYMTET_39724 [Cymbomonas tetramitiformis]